MRRACSTHAGGVGRAGELDAEAERARRPAALTHAALTVRRSSPPVASRHCASRDLARPPRARGPRRCPARDGGGRRRRAADLDDRQRPRRAAARPCRRSSRWPSARTSTTCSATRSPCSSSRTASRSRWPQVPQHVIDAFLAVEDKEFYRHDGVNVRSLVRATLSNFASDSPQQGASTITMQVVKNDFLAGLERDGRYKLLQVHYALMLEREHTKDEILERYLNTVFFGNNAYGIQAAAETYFGKTADQLTFIEAAFLAGLVRAPSTLRPDQQPRAQPGPLRPGARPPRRRRLRHRGRGRRPRRRPSRCPSGCARSPSARTSARTTPRRCATTCSTAPTSSARPTRSATPSCSAAGCASTRRSTRSTRRRPRAPATSCPTRRRASTPRSSRSTRRPGAIRAMVGGRGFVPGESEVNMALAPRQTGSSIKLFVLAAALQAGAQPDDVIDGASVLHVRRPRPAAVRHQGRRQPAARHARRDDVALDQLRLRPPGPDRRAQPDRRHRLPHGAVGVPLPGPAGRRPAGRAPRRCSRSSASRPAPTRCRPMDMAAGAQTIANGGLHHEPYYVECDRHRRRPAHLHPRRAPAPRCSTGASP